MKITDLCLSFLPADGSNVVSFLCLITAWDVERRVDILYTIAITFR